MSKKTYEMIQITKPIDGKELLDNVVIYLYSRLKECQIETNIRDNIYTILASASRGDRKSRLAYVTIEMIIHDDSCAVRFQSSKHRPIFNFVFAIAAAPIALPASIILTGTGLLHLSSHQEFKKDVIRYIETYVNQ
ncbi:MAG: hypothetical protein ACI4EQ_06280 [Lachnospiraceae bacterium]